MPREWRFRVGDIVDAIGKIELYTEGMDITDFVTDIRTFDAVLRNLEIIGEAAGNIPEEITAQYPQIPWRKMRGLRNVLAHEYFGVHPEIIWATVRSDLPPLKAALNTLLESPSDDAP